MRGILVCNIMEVRLCGVSEFFVKSFFIVNELGAGSIGGF